MSANIQYLPSLAPIVHVYIAAYKLINDTWYNDHFLEIPWCVLDKDKINSLSMFLWFACNKQGT